MKYKYIVFDNEDCTYETTETEDEAKALCEEWIQSSHDHNDGYSEEVCNGAIGYAKIEAVSNFVQTDHKDNYPCAKDPNRTAMCGDCVDPHLCEGAEEWEYDNDCIGEIVLKPINSEEVFE